MKVIEKHLRILDTVSKAAWVGCPQDGKPTHYKNFQNQIRNSLLSNSQPQKTIAETRGRQVRLPGYLLTMVTGRLPEKF